MPSIYSAWINWSASTATTDTAMVWTRWAENDIAGPVVTATTNDTACGYWTIDERGWIVRATPPTPAAVVIFPPVETQAQREARAAQDAELVRRAEDRRRASEAAAAPERQAADARAESLLLSWLTRRQRKTYREHGWFDVWIGRTRRYRLHRGPHQNVYLMERRGAGWIGRFCIQPRTDVPEADRLLTQALLLTHDEPGFRRTANMTPRQAA